jgi:hypothetical protein
MSSSLDRWYIREEITPDEIRYHPTDELATEMVGAPGMGYGCAIYLIILGLMFSVPLIMTEDVLRMGFGVLIFLVFIGVGLRYVFSTQSEWKLRLFPLTVHRNGKIEYQGKEFRRDTVPLRLLFHFDPGEHDLPACWDLVLIDEDGQQSYLPWVYFRRWRHRRAGQELARELSRFWGIPLEELASPTPTS